MKNDGKVSFVENSMYSLILVTKLKRIKIFSILKFYEKWWKSYFFQNSIYSLIIVIKLKIIQNFSILKISKILFNEKWWKSYFYWKLLLFKNNSYKTKNNSKFFNFENFKNFIQWKMM